MKRSLFLCLATLLFAMVSCEQDETNPSDKKGGGSTQLAIECITENATSISSTAATINGSVSIANAEEATGRAYFYYLDSEVDAETLKSDGTRVAAGAVSGNGGSFTASLNNLMPATTYYYAASVMIDGHEEFGNIMSFQTADGPVEIAVTGEYSDLGAVSVKLYGWCNQEGESGASVVYGIEYSSTDLSTNAQSIEASEKGSDNKFCCHVTGLTSNTLYYYRAFVLYNGVRSYGKVNTFKTIDYTATVSTLDASDISCITAKLHGLLSVSTNEIVNSTAWFLFSDMYSNIEDLITKGKKRSASINNNSSRLIATQLNPNTVYYYVAVIKVQDKESPLYGDVKSFKTLDFNPTITTLDASDISCTNATLNGSLSLNTTDRISTSCGFLWSENASNLEELKTSGHEYSLQTSNSDCCYQGFLWNSLIANTTYYYVAVAKAFDKEFYGTVKHFTTPDYQYMAEAVDLGLSVKWSSMNLGATKPEEYGAHFAWGETDYKRDYSWATYSLCNGSATTLTKYNNSATIEFKYYNYEDDAARNKLGGKWRTPTKEEWQELMDNCTWIMDHKDFAGHTGYTIYSNKAGYTDRSIFLPAAGYRVDTDHKEIGDRGLYWSSTRASKSSLAYYCRINLYTPASYTTTSTDRYIGGTVRPVTE